MTVHVSPLLQAAALRGRIATGRGARVHFVPGTSRMIDADEAQRLKEQAAKARQEKLALPSVVPATPAATGWAALQPPAPMVVVARESPCRQWTAGGGRCEPAEPFDWRTEAAELRKQGGRFSLRAIKRHVAKAYADPKVPGRAIESGCREAYIVRPRQEAMWLAMQLTGRSLPEVGFYFGERDHTTVLHAVNKIQGHAPSGTVGRFEKEPGLQIWLEQLAGELVVLHQREFEANAGNREKIARLEQQSRATEDGPGSGTIH